MFAFIPPPTFVRLSPFFRSLDIFFVAGAVPLPRFFCHVLSSRDHGSMFVVAVGIAALIVVAIFLFSLIFLFLHLLDHCGRWYGAHCRFPHRYGNASVVIFFYVLGAFSLARW